MLSKKTRIIRALIGLAIMIAGAAFSSWWGLVGLVPFIAKFSRIYSRGLKFNLKFESALCF